MSCYLFVHFRETTSPEGEQVHFGLSRDSFHWEALNHGRPILWAYYGDHGVRDMTVLRSREDGQWCLFVDYYGAKGAGQGYVPFVAPSLKSGAFVRSDAAFSFPYGFKHGTILPITDEEYDRMKAHDWTDVPDNR